MATSNDREVFLSRKEDFVFLEDVSGFQCARCDKVLFRHYISNCGHKFCLNCKKILDDGSRRWRCPVEECKTIIEDITIQDLEFDRKLFELSAHCPNHKYGCPFTGQLKDMGIHLKSCEDTRERALPVIYDKNDKYDVLAAIREMNNKLSQFEEKFESMGVALTEVKQSITEIKDKEKNEKLRHEKKWTDFDKRIDNITTEFDGRIDNMRAKFDGQINNLTAKFDSRINSLTAKFDGRINSLTVEFRDKMVKMNSETEKVGENAAEILKLKGKSETWFQMLELKDQKYHKGLEELKTEVGKIRNEIPDEKVPKFENQEVIKNTPKPEKLRMVNDCYKEKADYTWEITNVRSIKNGNITSTLSEVFPLRGYPFGSRVQVMKDSKGKFHFSLSYQFLEKTNTNIKIKLNPRIFWTFKEQRGNKDVVKSGTNLFGNQLQFNKPDYYELNNFIDGKGILYSPSYVVNDKMLIDIHVETPKVARLTYSHNGCLEWTLDDYRNRKRMEEEDLVEGYVNPYFFTSPKGYRVLVESYLDGCYNYQNRGLSVEINFVSGLYDDNLATHFLHETTVTVFNPLEPLKKITRSVKKDIEDDLYYAINIGTHQQIENLLNNDTLTYRVDIKKL